MDTGMLAEQWPALHTYDKILVAFSGGKDSLACLLHLLESGIDASRIELHHHLVDGDGSLMDWPVTKSYCEAVATAFGLPIFFSWREGGFEREMNRDGTPTAPVFFETTHQHGFTKSAGGKGPPGTRLRFPQVSADLSVRWCSAYLKIDVMAALIRNDPRFQGQRLLVITGERAEESPARARYATFEPHRSDLRNGRVPRHVDAWRPVHAWPEREVWSIIQRWGVVPHPAYCLGWGRLSCMCCIFGSANQWASIRQISPDQFGRIAAYEAAFGATIHRTRSVVELADRGTPYPSIREDIVAQAMADTFTGPIRLPPDAWVLPAGAYGEAAGPT